MAIDVSKAEASAKARGTSLAAQVERVRYGVYTVPSQSEPGVRWAVIERRDGTLQCTCPAGIVGRPCAHKAAVMARRQQEAKRSAATATFRFNGVEYAGTGANLTEALAVARPVRRA